MPMQYETGPREFTVGKIPMHNLADELEAAGMGKAEAQEEAFDTFLRQSGGIWERTSEVLLPDRDDQKHSFAAAMCVRRMSDFGTDL
jgi:hypothetical protein